MEEAVQSVSVSMVCPRCHLPVPTGAYFCPNCGEALREKPLDTSVGAQIWLYIFSAILPLICFLAIGKWQGFRYARSGDARAKTMGFVAIAILIVSTVVTFWLAAMWVQNTVQSELNGLGSSGLL